MLMVGGKRRSRVGRAAKDLGGGRVAGSRLSWLRLVRLGRGGKERLSGCSERSVDLAMRSYS